MAGKTIGFIGAGTMAEALVRGLLAARIATGREVLVSDTARARLEWMKRTYRVRTVAGNRDLVTRARIVFLAVKPHDLPGALDEAGGLLGRSHLVISIAAGVSLDRIGALLPGGPRLIRAMPNTPARVGEGATAFCAGERCTAADRKLAARLFGAVGRVVEADESLMDAVTGLSGSGPAYVFSLIQGLADGGVREGIPRAQALALAAQTVLGAARLVLESGRHPIELRDEVASPGGTTIAGLGVLEELGFQGALMDAVRAATERSRDLSPD